MIREWLFRPAFEYARRMAMRPIVHIHLPPTPEPQLYGGFDVAMAVELLRDEARMLRGMVDRERAMVAAGQDTYLSIEPMAIRAGMYEKVADALPALVAAAGVPATTTGEGGGDDAVS